MFKVGLADGIHVEWGKLLRNSRILQAPAVLPQALGVFTHGGSPNLVEVQGNLHGRIHTSVEDWMTG